MDDLTHEQLDFQVEPFKKKEECHCHNHKTIEDAIAFLEGDIKIHAATVDKEEGNDVLPDGDQKKNAVQKSCEEQVKRIHAAFPDSKNDQAHHLDLLHKVINAQLQVDVDKHKGEVHHHKKKHVQHYEDLKKAYFDSFK